jgi:hypothetical protein
VLKSSLTQTQIYFMTGGLPRVSSSWRQAPWDSRPVILFSNCALAVIVLLETHDKVILFSNWTLAVIVLYITSLWREDGSVVYNCCWSSPAQSLSEQSPTGLMTTFDCLRFETSPTWRAKFPYLYPPGTGWPGYTPRHWVECTKSSQSQNHIATDGQSISKMGLMTNYLLLFDSYGLVFVGRPL